eukprot:COSAG02_NODE_232_length_27935_cov_16.544511_14_plen_122_part_00
MDYVISSSRAAAEQASGKYQFVPVQELRAGIDEQVVPYEVMEPIEEDDESDEISSEQMFRGWEGVASASVRRGLRVLSKQQMHEKLLHTGEAGNCAICRTLRRGCNSSWESKTLIRIRIID